MWLLCRAPTTTHIQTKYSIQVHPEGEIFAAHIYQKKRGKTLLLYFPSNTNSTDNEGEAPRELTRAGVKARALWIFRSRRPTHTHTHIERTCPAVIHALREARWFLFTRLYIIYYIFRPALKSRRLTKPCA